MAAGGVAVADADFVRAGGGGGGSSADGVAVADQGLSPLFMRLFFLKTKINSEADKPFAGFNV